jgi:branched-chain amino acid transport system substrate-binding protein
VHAAQDFPGVEGKITLKEKRDAQKQAVVLKVENGKTQVVTAVQP